MGWQNETALPLLWLGAGSKGLSEFCVCLPGTARYMSSSWMQQRSLPALAREGVSESRAGERAGIGADDEDRSSAKQCCFVTSWDFSVARLPEPPLSESLLLHKSGEHVVLASCH